MIGEGPTKKSKAHEPKADEPRGTRSASDDIVPPSVAIVVRRTLLDEAAALQGFLSRCKTCNSIIGPDTIVCAVCNLPTQGDLTADEAAFVQSVANQVPQQFQEALERAQEGAANWAAAAPPWRLVHWPSASSPCACPRGSDCDSRRWCPI